MPKTRTLHLWTAVRRLGIWAALLMPLILACSKKNRDEVVTVRGNLSLPAGEHNGTMIVGVSTVPFEEILDDPIAHTKRFVATKDLARYELKLDAKDLAGAKELQVFAFLDRDFTPGQAPRISKDDLFGFYVNDLRPGLVLAQAGKSINADIQVDRAARDRNIVLPVELHDADNGAFQVGVYCAEIETLNPAALQAKHVAFVRPIEKSNLIESVTLKFPLFQASPYDLCYVFAYKDANRSLTMDPGESYGFYSDRIDQMPTQVNIAEPITTPLKINLRRTLPQKGEQSIIVKGNLSVAPELAAVFKRFFVFAIKYDGQALSPDVIGSSVLSFTRVSEGGGAFEMDLSASAVRPGDQVTVFALGDQSERGLPFLDEGDGLGMAIQDNAIARRVVQAGVNVGFDVNLKTRYYDGKATVKVAMESDYEGPMMLIAYRGSLSLDTREIDSSKVAGFVVFDKAEKKAQATLDVFSIGERWPLDVYVIGVLDANRNQKPDPGESIQFGLNAEGLPLSVNLKSGDSVEYQLNYLYTTQIPSEQNLTLKGRLHLSASAATPYVHVVVAQADDIEQILVDPLKHMRAMQKVPAQAKQYQISLTNTSLKPGDKVHIIAITSDADGEFPRLTDSSLVGFYAKDNNIGHVLKSGDNEGLDIVVDRTHYKDKVSIIGSLEDDYEGQVIATLYKGDPVNLVNQKYNYADFVAINRMNKNTRRLEVNFNTLITNQKLPIKVMPLAILDSNGNGLPDSGEQVYFSYDSKNNTPLILDVTPSLVTSFVFNRKAPVPTPGPVPIQLAGQVVVGANVGAARIFVMVIDADLQSLAPADIAEHLHAIEEIRQDKPTFDLDLSRAGLRPGDRVMIGALVDRDSTGFPQLTANDLVGFHSGNNSMVWVLEEGINDNIKIHVDRPLFEGQAHVSGSVPGAGNKDLLLVAYAGDVDSLTNIEVDPRKILGFAHVQGNAYFELAVSPFGQAFPVSCYIMAIADDNHNQALDPGETLYYASRRADRVPEKIELSQGQRVTLDLARSLVTQVPLGHHINLEGNLLFADEDKNSSAPAYIFVAKSAGLDSLRQDPLAAIRYLQKLDGRPATYAIDLAETDLKPGDSVMLGVWIDKDGSFSQNAGDRLGVYINGLDGYNLVLGTEGQKNLDIDVGFNLYDTQKTISVAFTGTNYEGRVRAMLYAGGITSLSLDSLDMKGMAAFADFNKSASQATFELQVLPTRALPIDNASLIALLDANGNGKPDAGEQLAFASLRAQSFPKPISVHSTSTGTLSLNSYYRIPAAANANITLKGVVESSVPNKQDYPTAVAVFRETALDTLTSSPLQHLQAFTILEPGVSNFSLNLANSDLEVEDRVMVVAFQNPTSNVAEQMQMIEGAYLGILLKGSTLDTAWTLQSGINDINTDGYGLVIKRRYYEHDGRVELRLSGNIPMAAGDAMGIGVYKADRNDLSTLTNVNYDNVVAYEKTTYTAGKTYSLKVFKALVDGLVNDERKIPDVIAIAWKDSNNNGKLEDNEPIGAYCDGSSLVSMFYIPTVSLTLNQPPGTLRFNGNSQTISSVQSGLLPSCL